MCHWRYFLKQLIVFMPELNEKDHKTVFITDGKPGLKELIQDIFTNVEVTGLLHNSSMITMVSLHLAGVRESALSVHKETLQGGFTV